MSNGEIGQQFIPPGLQCLSRQPDLVRPYWTVFQAGAGSAACPYIRTSSVETLSSSRVRKRSIH